MPLITYTRFGFNPTFNSFDQTGANTLNETGSAAAAPGTSGRIQRMHCYFAGVGVTILSRCVSWLNPGGGIAAKSPQFTAPSGTAATNGQTLNEQFMDAKWSLLLNKGTVLWLGFWRTPAASGVWSVVTGGSFSVKTDLSGDAGSFAAPTACGGALTCGDPRMFADINGSDPKRLGHGFPAYIRDRKKGMR